MKLNIAERLMLLNILPPEGSITMMKLLRVLREELSFNEKENKALEFKQEDTMLLWKEDANIVKDVKIGEIMTELIKKELKKLNDEEKLTEAHIDLYDKFIE
jgi:hypothetical protein